MQIPTNAFSNLPERAELQRLVDENENARAAKIDAQSISEAEVRAALKTFLSTIEAAVEVSADKTRLAPSRIVRLVELEEKSDQLRVYLNISDFVAETHKEKAAEGYSAASIAIFQPTPEFFGVKAGNFGVPAGSGSISVLSHFNKISLKVTPNQTQLRKKLSMC